jgi:hypothetical protein
VQQFLLISWLEFSTGVCRAWRIKDENLGDDDEKTAILFKPVFAFKPARFYQGSRSRGDAARKRMGQ